MKTSKILSLLLTAIFLFTATTIFAATKTWLAASGSWFSAQNWSPAGSPATGDTVVLDNGGTINIDQPLGFSGSFIWVRGTITSSSQGMALATNTVMEIHPGNYKILACSLFNEGLIRLHDGVTVYLENAAGTARIVNYGTLESKADDSFQTSGTGGGRIENLGRLVKSGGTGATTLSTTTPLINTGTVEARTGTIQIARGTLSGAFIGVGINHWAGEFLMQGEVASSNVLINANLFGTNVSLLGNWTWQTGNLGPQIGNSFNLASNTVLSLIPGNYKILHCPLTNHGIVRLSGSTTLYLDHLLGASRLVNWNLLDSTSDDGFAVSGTGGGRIENQGVFRKSGGGGSTIISGGTPLWNTGIVEAQTGRIQVNNGALAGVFLGAGGIDWLGNILMLGQVSSSNVLINANLYGTNVTLSGRWTWQTGNIGPAANNSFTLATNALLTLIPGNHKILHSPLTNRGTVRLTGPTTLYMDHGLGTARVVNLNLFECTGDDDLAVSVTSGGVMDNRAFFRKTGGAGVTSIPAGIPVVNIGVVEAQSGTIQISAGSLAGSFVGSGVNHWTGNLTVSGSVISSNVLVNANLSGTDATIHGVWTWQTGSFGPGSNGRFTLSPGSRLTLVPGNYKYLYCPITNHGLIRLTGNTSLYLDNAGGLAHLVNLGTVESAGNDLFAQSGASGGIIENRGTFAKTGGTAGTTVQGGVRFLNRSTGIVNVQADTCEIQNGDLGGRFTGAGRTLLTGNNTLRGELISENVELQSGNFLSRGLRLRGAVRWVTGHLQCDAADAGATLESDGLLTLVPGNYKYLYGQLTNLGIVRLTNNTSLYLDNSPGNTRLVNLNLLEFGSDDDLLASRTAGGVVDNRGTLLKSSGAGVSTVESTLLIVNSSTGTVTVNSGTLNLQNGQLSGTFNGAGKTLLNGNHTFMGQVSAQNVEMQSGNFIMGGASLRGVFKWVAGFLITTAGGPGGTLAPDCTLTLVPGNYKYLVGTLTNRGAIQLTGSTALYLDNGGGHARLVNHGLVESLGDDLFAVSSTIGGVLENRGWWRKSAGSGSTTIGNGIRFIHGSALEAFKGSFAFASGSFQQQGGTMAFRLNSDTDYGKIHISGVAPLGGGLTAQVAPGYNPAIGASFTVATYGSTNGSFSTHAFTSGHTWSVFTTNTFTRLTVTGFAPASANARFTHIEQITVNTFDLHLLVEPGRPYHMEASNKVGPEASWQYLGPFSSATSNHIYRHIAVGNPPPQQFFRAVSP